MMLKSSLAAIALSLASLVAAQPAIYPQAHWEQVVDPETVGWSKAGLDRKSTRLNSSHT